LEEIKEWGIADDQRRHTILRKAQQRKAAYQMLHEAWLLSSSQSKLRR
jgi:predicted Fe-S protein YdhL (DUF1289 family)